MRKAILSVLAMGLPLAAHGEAWQLEVHEVRGEEVYSIRGYPEKGIETFDEAVEAVPEGAWIQYVRFGSGMWRDETHLQRDILAYLRTHYPVELERALASSGNLHNPAVKALGRPLAEAVGASRFVARLGRVLEGRCHRIVDISHEKLLIFQGQGAPALSALIWLRTERCSPEEDHE